MDQAKTEWLPTANGNWIGCTEEGEVVYKNDMLKDNWEREDDEDVRKAKYLIRKWAEARKQRATIATRDPKAFGGQAMKDKDLENAAAIVERYKTKATAAVDKAYAT